LQKDASHVPTALDTAMRLSPGALRIVAGLLFLEHGVVKLFGFPRAPRRVPSRCWDCSALAPSSSSSPARLIVLGLFTRAAAFLAAGEMAAAYWMFHAPQSIYPAVNGGDAAILFCFTFLYLVAPARARSAWSACCAGPDRRQTLRRGLMRKSCASPIGDQPCRHDLHRSSKIRTDQPGRTDRTCASESRRSGPRARLLYGRARFRADAAFGGQAAFISAGGYHHHIVSTPGEQGRRAASSRHHRALSPRNRLPDRADLADALRG